MTDKSALVAKPEVAIQQVNLSYSAEQDRLLLRVGLADNSELLVWLTYRMTKQLWQLLNGETHMPTATSIRLETFPNNAFEQFKQEMKVAETLQKMDFATEYQPHKVVVNDGAMLAISLVLVSDAEKPPTLEIPCLDGIAVRMNLTQELILALCNMLQLSSKEAAWELGAITHSSSKTQVSTPMTADADVKKVLH